MSKCIASLPNEGFSSVPSRVLVDRTSGSSDCGPSVNLKVGFKANGFSDAKLKPLLRIPLIIRRPGDTKRSKLAGSMSSPWSGKPTGGDILPSGTCAMLLVAPFINCE